ncbi:DUF349 domain-containing protein [Tsukamurella ocularis]
MAENDPIAETTPIETAAPKPTPGARPGPKPHPGPRPGGPRPHAPAAAQAAPRTRPASDPTKYGRVDDDGTVYVVTSAGERAVGSWQAGESAEGLAHYGRKYDELATEVEVLEERLAGGTGDPKKVRAAAQQIADTLPTAAVVGDLDGLAARVGALLTGADTAIVTAQADREKNRSEGIARKEALAAEAEQIAAEATQWKTAGDRMRALLDEWKTIKGVDRKTDDALWKRYSKARDAFNKRRGAHFAELDRERAGAKARKEELIEQAEKLKNDTSWGETSAKFRDLLAKWKAAGRAPRDTDDALWARFKGIQDEFFSARNAAAGERDAEFAENGKAKQALLDEYTPRIESAQNLAAQKSALRELQDKWEAIGKVPREQMGSLEAGIRALEKKIKAADDTQWRRTDPEAAARAAQFRDRVAQFEEQAEKAEKAGKTKDAVRLREQAQQWREWADAAEGAIEDR